MKRFIPFLSLLLYIAPVQAQDHEATMYLVDGTEVTGLASIKFIKESFYGIPKEKIAFRVSDADDEPELWDSETISKIVFHNFGTPITFEYHTVKYIDGSLDSLFQVLTTGEVNLYAEAAGAWDEKRDNLKVPQPRHMKAKREGENDFAELTSKKKISAYFNQCPGIIDGLNNGEFSRTTIEEMVEYYNDSCASNSTDRTRKPATAGQ